MVDDEFCGDGIARVQQMILRSLLPIDEYGNPVERTKLSHPYSYDGFVLWDDRAENERPNMTVYSDRLFEWDSGKHDRLCQEIFGNKGQYWDKRDPEKIEAFLRRYSDNPKLKLLLIMEYCNQATGYPCWRFDYIG